MRIQPFSMAIVIAALTPSLALSQSQQYTNCHTLESANNFVGSDEVIVGNGIVCKVSNAQTAPQQVAVSQPAPPSPKSRKEPSSEPSSVITNARIIELSKLGLDDDIVIAKIRNGSCQFQLGDKDLVELKKAGVSPKVIAAMLDASASTSTQVTQGKSEALIPTSAVVKADTSLRDVPSEPGMYAGVASGLTKILGQIVDTKRSGSLLVSDLTLHIKTSKENVQILGAHAQTVLGSSPEFYFIPAKQEADAGVNAGDLILIRLEEKPDRRQFEIAAKGAWRASQGIALSHQVQLSRSEVKPGVYKIQPSVGLPRGEYGLYLSRGEGMAPYIYDFSVQ